MRYCVFAFLIAMCFILMSIPTGASTYIDSENDVNYDSRNYIDDIMSPEKRACVRRGGNCDHRPSECCYSSSCRCNLWGSNCRCQRMGLFQKWG